MTAINLIEILRAAVYDHERGEAATSVRIRVLSEIGRAQPALLASERGVPVATMLASLLATVRADDDPVRRSRRIADCARGIDKALAAPAPARVPAEEGGDLGAQELWDRFGIKSAPLFDPAHHCYSEVPAEWVAEVTALILTVQRQFPAAVIRQIKPKFGSLRFYVDAKREDAWAIEDLAQKCNDQLAAGGKIESRQTSAIVSPT